MAAGQKSGLLWPRVHPSLQDVSGSNGAEVTVDVIFKTHYYHVGVDTLVMTKLSVTFANCEDLVDCDVD